MTIGKCDSGGECVCWVPEPECPLNRTCQVRGLCSVDNPYEGWFASGECSKACSCWTKPCTWTYFKNIELYSAALAPGMVGDPRRNRFCQIIDATNCTSCECTFYVKYTLDGGQTWQGVDQNGQVGTGGTGCPGEAYGSTQATSDQALEWLRDMYIRQTIEDNIGLCGCYTKSLYE